MLHFKDFVLKKNYAIIAEEVYMKNFYIFLVLALITLSIFAYRTADPSLELISKLEKFQKLENIYYQSEINFKFMDLQDTTIIIKQFKRGDDYNAKIISPLSKTQNIVQVKDGKLSYEQVYMMVEGTADESKYDKSFFWFDKIDPRDIERSSVKKIKTPNELKNKKCKMFSAKLAESGTDFDICIGKENVPVYIKYYDVKKFIPLLYNINPITSVTQNSGDVVVNITDIQLKPEYDRSFNMPARKKFAIRLNVSDIKAELERQKAQYAEVNKSMKELQTITKDLKKITEDLEKEEAKQGKN